MKDPNRPDLEGNDEASTGGAGEMAAHTKDAGSGEAKPQGGHVAYAAAGKAFTNWFNGMLARTPNPVLRLGTKAARVETLHDDGRLVVHVEGEGGKSEPQFVAFDAKYLDALLLKFASAAR